MTPTASAELSVQGPTNVSDEPSDLAEPLWPIEPLWSSASVAQSPIRGGALPPGLRARLAGRLEIPLRSDRPTIVANFVSTIDGAVALDRSGETGGREISGAFEPDRFLMGLLRATADAVLVGAGTVRGSDTLEWTPGRVHRPSAELFARWRSDLGLAPDGPTTVILSGSGRIDLDRVGARTHGLEHRSRAPVLVVTTAHGAQLLRRQPRIGRVEVAELPGDEQIPMTALLDLLDDRGFGLVVSEAGPMLFGQLLAARLVDELFLTLAPSLVGRTTGAERLALVEGVAFAPPIGPSATSPSATAGSATAPSMTSPRPRLRSVMRSADYLFLRYGLDASGREGAP